VGPKRFHHLLVVVRVLVKLRVVEFYKALAEVCGIPDKVVEVFDFLKAVEFFLIPKAKGRSFFKKFVVSLLVLLNPVVWAVHILYVVSCFPEILHDLEPGLPGFIALMQSWARRFSLQAHSLALK
jgi:hypothetical protein